MEMEPHERGGGDSEMDDESPMSHNGDEELSDPEGDLHDDMDSNDEAIRNRLSQNNISLEHHPDVLAKLKMQVRDLKVWSHMEREELEQLHKTIVNHTNGTNLVASMMANSVTGGNGGGSASVVGSSNGTSGGTTVNPFTSTAAGGLPIAFPFPHPAAAFLPPLAPPPAPPSSGGSSHSSEGSASSQHTWSFEEQFKQVRQLYEINDDPKRKEFLDDLFSYMQKRGTPINRLPIMAKSVLDLYELYNLVIARGGLVDVINKKLWQEIIKGLHLPSSITSAAFTLRTQYMKYLYPYECEKRRLSTPAELQAAIDGNRREGRRSSYGTYNEMVQRSPIPTSQMSPLSLVTQQQNLLNRMSGGGLPNGGAHHPSHPQPLGQPPMGGPIPALPASEFEARMVEYVKLLNKELRSTTSPSIRHGSPPNNNTASPLDSMTRFPLWNLYSNPPPQLATPTVPVTTSPRASLEPQREALNLADTTPSTNNIGSSSSLKRELDSDEQQQSAKRLLQDGDITPPPVESPTPSDETSPARPSNHLQSTPSAALSTNIKITNRDSENGDNSLVVSMELNGVMYQGVLFAQQLQAGNNHRNTRIST